MRPLLTLLWGLAHGLAPEPGSAAIPPYVRVVSSTTSIAPDQAVGDVLVIDGRVEIFGVVRGHVFAVDGQVDVGPAGMVLGSITVTGGDLHVREGAAVPKAILIERDTSTTSLALMKRVLPFGRFVPDPELSVSTLDAWSPGMDLEERRALEDPDEVVIGGLVRLKFVSRKVRDTFQRGFKGDRGTVLISAIRLSDSDSARALFSEISRAGDQAGVKVSVKCELGDGAHWFFRRKKRYTMLWTRGDWVLAVESRLAAGRASILEEQRFSEEVLEALERGLPRRTVEESR